MPVDEVVWTDEGRAALAKAGGLLSLADRSRDELCTALATSLARFRPCWQRGLEKGKTDAVGAPLVTFAMTYEPGQSPLTVDQAAGLASLLGARSDDHDLPFLELVIRDQGAPFAVDMLVRMWSLVTDYDDPDWPTSEKRLAIFLRAIDGTSSNSVNDSSVSHGKGRCASYMAARGGIDVSRVWDSAPLWARPALAVAAGSRELAERVTRELTANRPEWYPHYANKELPLLVGTLEHWEALKFVKDGFISLRFLERHGTGLLPLLEARCQGKLSPYQRERVVEILVNIRGPRAAALLAGFAGKSPVAMQVKAYFARYPDLASEAPPAATSTTKTKAKPAKATSARKR